MCIRDSGATRNEKLLKNIGEAVAKEVLSTGIVWTFAPTIAVPQNDLWGRTYEGFAEDPELVSKLGKNFILGFEKFIRSLFFWSFKEILVILSFTRENLQRGKPARVMFTVPVNFTPSF